MKQSLRVLVVCLSLQIGVVAGVPILGPVPRLMADEEIDTPALYKKSVDSVAFIAAPKAAASSRALATIIC